ncbi:MAG: vWA domain-containing protein [Gammaproteobacteria bacterium]
MVARDDIRFWGLLAGFVILLLVFVVPAIAMSRPVYSYMFIVDITRSMNTEDYELNGMPTSRLDYIKRSLRHALQQLPCESRAGLGIFTERTPAILFEPVEVCENFSAIDGAIQQLDWRMAWAADSYVATGLLRAIEMLRNTDANLVFMSDGHEAPPMQENYRPTIVGKPGKVKGMIVGVGGHELVRMPKYNEDGMQIGFYRESDVPQENRFGLPPTGARHREGYHPRNAPFGANPASGNEHLSSVREAHLKRYARETGLRYLHLDDTQDFSDALRNEAYAKMQKVDANIRWVPASATLALLVFVYGIVPLVRRWQ